LKIEDALNGKFKAWKDKRDIDNKVKGRLIHIYD
jgi:hypothetical protein